MPLIYSLPTALIAVELATMFPETTGGQVQCRCPASTPDTRTRSTKYRPVLPDLTLSLPAAPRPVRLRPPSSREPAGGAQHLLGLGDNGSTSSALFAIAATVPPLHLLLMPAEPARQARRCSSAREPRPPPGGCRSSTRRSTRSSSPRRCSRSLALAMSGAGDSH